MARSRLTRLATMLAAALALLLALAPAALAADGVGLYGRTDDRVVTYAGFILIAFFAILVIVLSLVQTRLENRRERLKGELERLRRP
jgi:ABC-type nickel/cobalt efflux system permease component RcnA